MSISVVPATVDHAAAIELRPGDAREIAALGNACKTEAIVRSINRSLWADAYLADGEVAAITGLSLVTLLGGGASLWVMTGKPVDRHRKDFLRLTRARVAEVRKEWPVLTEYVHAEYAEAIRWLKWLGYTIGPAEPYGPLLAPFCRASIGDAP